MVHTFIIFTLLQVILISHSHSLHNILFVVVAIIINRPVVAYGLLAAAYMAYSPGKLIWYSWHPFFMIIGFAPLAIVAILYKKVGGYENTKLHGILMTLSTLSASFAFYVIYSNKNTYKKQHFTTLHGQGGLAIMIAYLGLALVGFIGLNPDWGFMRTNKTIRAVHKRTGQVVSVSAWLSCIFQFMKMVPSVWVQILLVLPLAVFGVIAIL